MGMKDKAALVKKLQNNPFYVQSFTSLFGKDIFSDVDQAYLAMTKSIAAFESTTEFAPFDSKYDRYLKGEYTLTDHEELGRSLFFSNNNTNCATCHQLKASEDQTGETFTNYEYHNIGTPKNTALRSKNGKSSTHIDHGLLENPAITDQQHDGKFKVPTLRNIAVTGPYMHNGVFQELSTVLAFYDKFNNKKRHLNPENKQPWNAAEVPATVNKKDLKAKKLTDAKMAALEAFLRTLTDKRFEHLLK
jgi:cytochrome c peroxidase